MRNKILTSVIITVIFAISIVACSFMMLINMEQTKITKEELKNINYLIYELNDVTDVSRNDYEDLKNIKDIKINDVEVRITLIDSNGVVLYDNEQKSSENHKDRIEVKEAFEKGEGYSERYSDTIKGNLIYYATRLSDNYVIRSSVSINTITLLQKENIKYSVGILMLVLPFSLFLSLRLVKKIIDPVKELESVTLKMTHGDYKIRANIETHDELGILGNSFNNMADQLQIKIREVIDKQNKIESILKSMENGVVAVDNHNRVISINPRAEALLEIRKNIVGEYLLDHINDYDISKFLMKDEESDKEIKLLHPFERDYKIKKSDMFDGVENIGKVIIFQDITDINRVELMRSQFVANVSHELKTPLTSIKGFAETLKFVKDDETREKFLDIIDKEAERLSRLINDILVLSNIESNLVIDMKEFEPSLVIEEVINMMRKTAINKNIKLEFINNNSKHILGDKDKFYQLVLNLIENAIKYSKDGSGCVEVTSYNKDAYYCLRIKDNGIGIPEEDISRIFERFYRVDKSRKKGGTGLGLAIVKHIVKIFNGEINVKSKLSEGTIFEVKIPYM